MNSYRSLIAWQLAHELALYFLRAGREYWTPWSAGLIDQVRRAAVSVEANIVEGYALGTVPQFRRHLRIALGSAAEVECLVTLAGEADYLPPDVAKECVRICGPLLSALRGLIRSKKLRPAP